LAEQGISAWGISRAWSSVAQQQSLGQRRLRAALLANFS
jgi:hypothetical protein